MESGVVASLSVGWVMFVAWLLLGIGVGLGWLWAHRRYRRRQWRLYQEYRAGNEALLKALPLPAALVERASHHLICNPLAEQLLKDLLEGNIPLAIDAAVERVCRSGLTETLEISVPTSPARRLQISVTSLWQAEALVLFQDPLAGSGRIEAYRQLISTLAHELRTPLTAIMGHVEILNSTRPEEEALWRRSLGFVAGEAERLARLVEDILSLSRLDRLPLNLQAVNLRVLAEEAISEMFEAAERNLVSPLIQAPADLPRVMADPDRLRQVFLNLFDNAIKYAPCSTLIIGLSLDGDKVHVEVSDTGPGIPTADLPHIFEPFQRGQGVISGVQGTGLGLTLVRAILEQHHASIYVHSEEGQGTNFSFSLPIAPSASRAG